MDEGYIKFKLDWKNANAPIGIRQLVEWRNKLYEQGLIGVYHNGIGFGNISIRSNQGFIISGSATGHIKVANDSQFTEVIGYDFDKNWVSCRGPVKASSESLTHAAIYEADKTVNAVIHIHNLKLWKELNGKAPTTNAKAEYGTPEMACEIIRLLKDSEVRKERVIVMGGHEEGILFFGPSTEKTFQIINNILINYFN